MPEPRRGGLRERLFEPAAGEIERAYRVRRRRARGRSGRFAAGAVRLAGLTALRVRFAGALLVALLVALLAALGRRERSALLRDWPRELRQALRQLRRRPLAALAAVAVLGIAIGAATSVFSVVHAVLLAPLPFPEPQRLVRVVETFEGRPASLSVANWRDFARGADSLDQIGVWFDSDSAIDEGEPERLNAFRVSASFFAALGVSPERGRVFEPAEDRAGGEPAIVLSHALWMRRYGGDPGLLGRRIGVDGGRHTVVGVMPPGFDFPGRAQAWLPLALSQQALDPGQRGAHYLRAVGRLAPGAEQEQAAEQLARVAAALQAEYPRSNAEYGASAIPLHRFTVGEVRAGLLWLWAAVVGVLLLACADVAALQLAGATARRGELALRAAHGARASHLLRQLASEALLLALLGGALGVALAAGTLSALPALLPADLPRSEGVRLHTPVLLFSLAASLLTALGFGIAPALLALRLRAGVALEARGLSGSGPHRWYAPLLAAQAAAAVLLLVGSGLALRSLAQLGAVDPGFDPSGVVAYSVSLPAGRYPEPAAVAAATERLVERARALPGVAHAASVSLPPLAPGSYHSSLGIEGREDLAGAHEPHAAVRAVSPDYFAALGIPLREGRDFDARDRDGAIGVAIVSATAARSWWPNASPLGARLRVHAGVAGPEQSREVVGVVGDVRMRSLAEAPLATVYLPQAQYPWDTPWVLVRSQPGHRVAAESLAATARGVDPQLAAWGAGELRRLLDAGLAESRFRARLLTGFAAAALLLAAVGLYGVMAFAVGRRSREIGVRLALGARARDVRNLVLRGDLLPVALGTLVGLVAAALLAPLLEHALFGVAPLDLPAFLAAPALLLVTALVACLRPALAASRLDPVRALRAD